MSQQGDGVCVRVSGADPAHAEREARALRDALREIDDVGAVFAETAQDAPAGPAAKGPILSPDVVLLVTGGSFTAVTAGIRAWAQVRKSRRARIELPDGTVAEIHGGMSAAEIDALREALEGRR